MGRGEKMHIAPNELSKCKAKNDWRSQPTHTHTVDRMDVVKAV